MKFLFFILIALLTIIARPLYSAIPSKPNIVLFVADDLNRYDVSCYGAVNTKTPNIDSLAKAGMRMNQAYCAFATCSPCRAELYSGRFPVNNGLIGNGVPSRSNIKSVVQYLGALGYRTGLAGKHHVGPSEVYAFDDLNKESDKKEGTASEGLSKGEARKQEKSNKNKEDSEDKNEGKDVENYLPAIRAYMTQKKDQPFLIACCSHQPHQPWTKGNAAAFDVKKLVVPPNLYDCPATREELTHYYAEVEYLDWQVGEVMKIVQELGLVDQTLFMFVSEQGAMFPGGKFTSNDPGVHAAMVVRWPGKIAPGTQSNAIVHYADVVPTFVEAAGGKMTEEIDGRSFLEVLMGKKEKFRDYAYAVTTNILPRGVEGGYPIRGITDGRYKLIVNYEHEKTFFSPGMSGAYKTWKRMAATDPKAKSYVDHYEHHPQVELYDLEGDPWEMKNVAESPEHKGVLDRLTQNLNLFLASQKDDPFKTEKIALDAKKAKVEKSGRVPGSTEE